MSYLFSALWSNPSSCPLLKNIAFLDCDITEGFMEELTRFASDRKSTTSVWLDRVVIVQSEGKFPSAELIRGLEEHVPVVEVLVDTKLPTGLMRGIR